MFKTKVRIATHPNYQGMGYGSKALELLEKYYEGSMASLDESHEKSGNEQANIVADEVSCSVACTQPPSKLSCYFLRLCLTLLYQVCLSWVFNLGCGKLG